MTNLKFTLTGKDHDVWGIRCPCYLTHSLSISTPCSLFIDKMFLMWKAHEDKSPDKPAFRLLLWDSPIWNTEVFTLANLCRTVHIKRKQLLLCKSCVPLMLSFISNYRVPVSSSHFWCCGSSENKNLFKVKCKASWSDS